MTQRSFTLQLPDAAATHALGVQLGRVLPAGTVLLLNGDLGSGKTSLVQGLGAGLGIVETVDSPTFTLVNEYLSGRLPLYHMDLYRLSAADTSQLALDNYWDEQEVEPGIVAIEWAERLPEELDVGGAIALSLSYADPGRTAVLTALDAASDPLVETLSDKLHELLADEV